MAIEWWPLPDGQKVGDERAAELAGYVRERAAPVVEIAKVYLRQRNPEQEIKVSEARARALSKQSLTSQMTEIPIATVTAGTGSTAHVIRIGLERTGRITAHLSKASDPVMRSVSV
jgi:hypothetical protein